MFGTTNAQGIAGPDLEVRLNAYHQETITPLYNELNGKISLLDNNKCAKDSVTALYNELSAKIGRLEKNPPVGSVTLFGGFEWLVAHWDTENKIMILSLKELFGTSAYGVLGGTKGFEQELLDFANLDAVLDKVPERANDDAEYVFVPTLRQLGQEFALFRNGQYANCAAKRSGEYNAYPWLLNSTGTDGDGNAIRFIVEANGFYSGNLSDRAYRGASEEVGFRPFIRMKMR